jgi:hypothetical protein
MLVGILAFVVFGLLLFVLLRFGFLALAVCIFALNLTIIVPLTLDTSVPYAGASYLMIGTIVGLALYGFQTALAGRPVFGAGFLDGEPARPSPL